MHFTDPFNSYTLVCDTTIMEKSDLEKASSGSGDAGPHAYEGEVVETETGTRMSRFVDSFKRNPNARMVTVATGT